MTLVDLFKLQFGHTTTLIQCQLQYRLLLAAKSVKLATIDTTSASIIALSDGNIYNNIVMFDTPIAIPANHKFWAGIILPTGAGNAFVMPINFSEDGSYVTHSGEFWSDLSFHFFDDPNNWGIDATIPVYPIVNFASAASIEQNTMTVAVYPNPTNSILNIKTNVETSTISILSLDGKVVATSAINGLTGTINVSELVNGVYFYEVTSVNGAVTRNTFVKN